MEKRTIILLLILLFTGIVQAQFTLDNALVNSSTSFYVIGYAEFTGAAGKTVRDTLWNVIVNYPKIQKNTVRGSYNDFASAGYYDIRIEFIVNDSGKISNFVSNLETLRNSVQARKIIIRLFYCDTLITDWTDLGNKYSAKRLSEYVK